jgi:hypothetical protein
VSYSVGKVRRLHQARSPDASGFLIKKIKTVIFKERILFREKRAVGA